MNDKLDSKKYWRWDKCRKWWTHFGLYYDILAIGAQLGNIFVSPITFWKNGKRGNGWSEFQWWFYIGVEYDWEAKIRLKRFSRRKSMICKKVVEPAIRVLVS